MKQLLKNILLLVLLISSSYVFAQCDEGANVWNDSWTSCKLTPNPNTTRGNSHWLLYEFDQAQVIDAIHIWNANTTGESQLGVKDLSIDYSVDGNTWEELGNYVIPRANERDDYEGFDDIALGNVLVKKILITGLTNHNSNSDCVSLSEVQFEIGEEQQGTINLALFGRASQSSTDDDGYADRAIDNNTNGGFKKDSVTHTQDEEDAFWQVDLAQTSDIEQIVLWNRTDDCCASRLANYTVSVLNANGAVVWRNTYANTPNPSFKIDLAVTGNTVKVELDGIISLAELQVFGKESGTGSSANNLVRIIKRNANYAIHSSGSGSNTQNVTLWQSSHPSQNLNWIEIDMGNGYYSYQRENTDFCIDGGVGGVRDQNVHLWRCDGNNQNQHWQKVPTDNGFFKLVKRNASGFALNGGNNGVNGQNVNLFDASNSSHNLQWSITAVSAGTSAKTSEDFTTTAGVIIYPNPVVDIATVQGAVNSIIDIYDMNGRVLISKQIVTENQQIDLSAFETGIYYAQVKGLEIISVIKVVKQ